MLDKVAALRVVTKDAPGEAVETQAGRRGVRHDSTRADTVGERGAADLLAHVWLPRLDEREVRRQGLGRSRSRPVKLACVEGSSQRLAPEEVLTVFRRTDQKILRVRCCDVVFGTDERSVAGVLGGRVVSFARAVHQPQETAHSVVGDDIDTGNLQALGSRFGGICKADISSESVVLERPATQTHNCRTRWYLDKSRRTTSATVVVESKMRIGEARRTIDDQVVRVVRGDVTDNRSRPAGRRPHLSLDVPAELVAGLPRENRRVVRVREPVVRVDATQKLPDVRLRERGSRKLLFARTAAERSGPQ